MQQEQPQFYSNLLGHLSAEDQSTLQGVMSQADLVAAQAEQERAQANVQAVAQAQAEAEAAAALDPTQLPSGANSGATN